MDHGGHVEAFEGQIFVVSGGAGYFGARLCLELLRRSAKQVRCFDWETSRAPAVLRQAGGDRLSLVKGDVSKAEDVESVMQGADAVFHCASFGMSGKEMLRDTLVSQVNIDGTLNVLNACVRCGVRRLVYTSTYNVIFGGQEINGGDERMEYFPLDKHVDAYAQSKALAEQFVLKYTGTRRDKDSPPLLTCAIRPAAIYGPGEARHFPRIMRTVGEGLFVCVIGPASARVDWVHVDNLVHGHCLAAAALWDRPRALPEGTTGRGGIEELPPAAGQVYFISDNAPVNQFEFLRPIVEAYGGTVPTTRVSVRVALVFAWGFDITFRILQLVLSSRLVPEPPILPAEVYKVGVNHFFSTAKARLQLGYRPVVSADEGSRQMVEHWREVREREVPPPPLLQRAAILLGMLLLFLSAFVPRPHLPFPLQAVQRLGLIIFFSRETLQVVWWAAWGIHVCEAFCALLLARTAEPQHAAKWFFQTLVYGFFSLRLLLRRISDRALDSMASDSKSR